jgi:methoxymalonate biosynthesis protein
MTPDQLADARTTVSDLVGDRAAAWDLSGQLPVELLREFGARGLLCAQVPSAFGGLGISSRHNGELTAHVGYLCGSLRSMMTSHGMAAWTVQRLGSPAQRDDYLARLTKGELAAVAMSEPAAGSDLSGMQTEIRPGGESVILHGEKMWVTGASYADLLVVAGRHNGSSAIALVPATAPGVHIEPIAAPLGCRAAGHAHLRFDEVRLPASSVLGGGGNSLPMLITTVLSYGRISVAWGCVGILRACLSAAARHAKGREQFGKPLAQHQLVARHLAELMAAEQVSTRVCEHASDCWDSGSPDVVIATLLAKHVSASHAAQGSASAVQVLASAGAQDGHQVARAYRDAKLMEIIEGSSEICQLILAQHAMKICEEI